MRNTRVEDELTRKNFPRYLGPYIYISRNRGGAILLCELNGAMLRCPIAAFRVIPYFARKDIELPSLEEFLDVNDTDLKALENSFKQDPDHDINYDAEFQMDEAMNKLMDPSFD
jgi:hypothetical protein